MNKDKQYFTQLIKARGWTVKDAYIYWGRSYDFYHRNCNGDMYAKRRLEALCTSLPMTEEARAIAREKFDYLMVLSGVAGEAG